MTKKEQQYIELLMEDMNGKFTLILEGHAALDAKIERFHKEAQENHCLAMDFIKFSHDTLKEEIQGVRTELKGEIQDLRTELKGEIQDLRTELKGEIQDLRTELKSDIQDLRMELKGEIQDLRTELKGEIQDLRTELKQTKDDLRTEMAAGFKSLAGKLENHEGRIFLLEKKCA